MREHWEEKPSSTSFDIAEGTYTYFSWDETPSKDESETCDMRGSSIDILKTAKKITSITVRAVAFYLLYYATLCFSMIIAENVTGYTFPDNPVKSDYPAPVLFEVIAFLLGPYVFWLLVLAAYDVAKYVRKNA